MRYFQRLTEVGRGRGAELFEMQMRPTPSLRTSSIIVDRLIDGVNGSESRCNP
jgi:hypothetical protein